MRSTRPRRSPDWQLPEEFATLRRLLEARMGKPGKREFVQVLRLMETFRIEDVTAAVRDAIAARRDRLRCHQASGAVPDRAAAAAPRHDGLSVSAEGDGRDDVGARLHGPAGGSGVMTDTPQVLLAHHLKALKLPTFLREYDKVARQCAAEGVDYPRYLLRLVEPELIERERRMVERRIKAAKFPTVKSLDSFDFAAFPALNKALVMELARSRVRRAPREHHRGRQLRHRQEPHRTGARPRRLPEGPVGRLHERRGHRARADRGPRREAAAAPAAPARRLQAADHRRTRLRAAVADRRRAAVRGVLAALRARLARIVTSNLPFDEWTSVFGSERLTGALLDRLTHHVHILEMNGESYRLAHSKRRSRRHEPDATPDDASSGLSAKARRPPRAGAFMRCHGDGLLLRPADAKSLRR